MSCLFFQYMNICICLFDKEQLTELILHYWAMFETEKMHTLLTKMQVLFSNCVNCFFSCPVILTSKILTCPFNVAYLSVWLQQRRFIGSTSLVLPWGQKQEGGTICSVPSMRDVVLLRRSLHQPCAPHWHVIVRFYGRNVREIVNESFLNAESLCH